MIKRETTLPGLWDNSKLTYVKLENPNRKTEIEGIQVIFEDIVTEKK